jgi:hypothetical protein
MKTWRRQLKANISIEKGEMAKNHGDISAIISAYRQWNRENDERRNSHQAARSAAYNG